MIGASLPTVGNVLEQQHLNLPLPFFYSRDSGVALPTAALPYNEMRINFVYDWREMLCVFDSTNCSCEVELTAALLNLYHLNQTLMLLNLQKNHLLVRCCSSMGKLCNRLK